METRKRKHTEKRKRRKIFSAVLALLVIVALAVPPVAYAANTVSGGSLWNSVVEFFTGNGVQTLDATVKNDSDFLITYSALATSTQIEGESNVPCIHF